MGTERDYCRLRDLFKSMELH